MAKNQIENGVLLTNPPRTVGNRDHFQRMNYLYQLAFWQTVDGHDGEQALARLYAKNMDLVSKRTRAEMLPHIKRTICKRCKRVLVPLRTMQMGMHKSAFEMQCVCGKKRKFAVGLNKGYRCYAEREENLLKRGKMDLRQHISCAKSSPNPSMRPFMNGSSKLMAHDVAKDDTRESVEGSQGSSWSSSSKGSTLRGGSGSGSVIVDDLMRYSSLER